VPSATRIAGEVTLHRSVVQRIVQRRHDHRLVQHQVAMPNRSGSRVEGVEEATHAVDVRELLASS
jgi:hypothetical protein